MRKLKLEYLTYGLICLLSPSGPNAFSRPQNTKVNNFFDISSFYQIHLMLIEKMRFYLWKFEQGFCTYGLIYVLGPSGPNVVSIPRTQGQEFFWEFIILLGSSYKSWENEVLFMEIGGRVLNLVSKCSF